LAKLSGSDQSPARYVDQNGNDIDWASGQAVRPIDIPYRMINSSQFALPATVLDRELKKWVDKWTNQGGQRRMLQSE
jgi:hypothetical protein